jgi:hypothetical protein
MVCLTVIDYNVPPQTLSPTSAIHSVLGQVKRPILNSDNKYVRMRNGNVITITFPYVPLQGEERDFIFVGEGFYVTPSSSGKP